ncbi:hypothetical protein EH223_06850 [candidate division KSB1 bacterium]|nr:hypothetical protein [candidate division KSB1 bacterium]RQW04707.1 MAG: hypothetical protein EH223_06850 [candidate division KSB1 bacterium]
MYKFRTFILVMIVALFSVAGLFAQITIDQLHGDQTWSMPGLHSGNQIRTVFYNDGMIGDRQSDELGGEWPINSGYEYLSKSATMIGAEVEVIDDSTGTTERIVILSEGNGSAPGSLGNASSGDVDPNTGDWWSMTPLPYFANQFPEPDQNGNERKKQVAMSHWRWSWPNTWPDKFDDVVDPGWPGSWDGYFGKNVLNADQESYYVMDDYNNREWPFYPDSTDLSRRGLGIRATVRQFQWSNVLVEDCLFFLYDAMNIGTYEHDKMVFGLVSGPNVGIDSDDDGGAFILESNLGYQFDIDNIGSGGWTPVGLLGWAFFESPGNPFDGIDNDGDAVELAGGMFITEDTFAPKQINLNDDIVLTDYKSFERTVTKMPAEGVKIRYLGREYHIKPGDVAEEIQNDLIDNNLNGLIDESNGSIFGSDENAVHNFLYVGLKAINYLTGDGLQNILIDERRDDNIDNDGDWNMVTDDVGLDGVPRTGDPGEGDGVPTSGAGTLLPGEPHIDKTDIDESDMIGLTSFNIHEPWTIYPIYDDQIIWDEAVRPGYLNDLLDRGGNTDVFLGSGYFPLKPQDIERFSIGMLFGYGPTPDELIRNHSYAERTYLENYNFAKAPNLPTLKLIPGDGRVTLIWDTYAEQSIDPILGVDFEGYRIYRSTDPGWNDMAEITDGYGSGRFRKPLVQFDLANDIKGYSFLDIEGVQFWLGDDTGLVNSWTDTTCVNGQTYYYAVTAYDHGSDSLGIVPSETAKYISIDKTGQVVDKGTNVGVARPEAPSLGFQEASVSEMVLSEGGTTTGRVGYEIVDATAIKDDNSYKIVFEDTVMQNESNQWVVATKNFSLLNVTTGQTLIDKSSQLDAETKQPITEGFIVELYNPAQLAMRADSSYWNNNDSVYAVEFVPYRYSRTNGIGLAHDYLFEFGEVGVDTSAELAISAARILPPTAVNFTVKNLTTGAPVEFGFYERDVLPGEEGKFTAYTDRNRIDEIILLESRDDSTIITWQLVLTGDYQGVDSLRRSPRAGDILQIKTSKPFLSNDVFEFTTTGRQLDQELAAVQMDLIKVVPNPYVVTNSWEPLNPYTNGRGPRELHFTHLPSHCTIKIFNIRGQLVREIEHNHSDDMANGTEVWNMLSKDEMEIAYGVYIYHVDAGEHGQKIGKFAIIK